MKITFTVLGEPQGKARPKFSRKGGYVFVRTPEKTKAYENSIQAAFLEQCGNSFFSEGSKLDLQVLAYFEIPKSTTKKKRQAMLSGEIRPTKKPDADNILKVVADALNGVAYKDDACVVKMDIEKWYAEVGSINVLIKEC